LFLPGEYPVSTLAGRARRAEKSDKMGSRLGSNDQRKTKQNPYKIHFFKAFARREHCLGGVKFSGGYGQGWATVQNRTKPGQNRTLLKMFSSVRRLKRAFSAYYVEFRCSRAGEPGNLGVQSS